MKIVVVIGQSASGKTTFVKDRFIDNQEIKLINKPFAHTIVGKVCLLGDYIANKRCVGTDTLSMSILPQILEFIPKNNEIYNTIIAEGDRITSYKFIDFLYNNKEKFEIEIHYFICSLEDSIKRRLDAGSNSSVSFINTTITKSRNVANYAISKGFNIIKHDTTEIKNNLELF